jgi:hypothetical protein
MINDVDLSFLWHLKISSSELKDLSTIISYAILNRRLIVLFTVIVNRKIPILPNMQEFFPELANMSEKIPITQ